ncbi:MAG: hypothetical protein HZA36_03310 [Parcubacteria group bacterium]|nr:hypothetical protein [Parcubacteria group bacterium]
MTPKEKLLSALEVEGINLTRKAQEDSAPYWEDSNHLENTFRGFHDWCQKIKDFIIDQKINSDIANFFFRADSVPPHYVGLYEYRIDKEKSRELLKNIRIETSKKLDYLEKMRGEVPEKNENRLRSLHLITLS